MDSASKFFLEWVIHLASNYQIGPHGSEPVVPGWAGSALHSALFQAVSPGPRKSLLS